jgi:hypothetical protein
LIPRWSRFTPYALIVSLVVLLWVPYGIRTTGLMEEWLIRNEWENPNPSQRGEEFDLVTLTGAQRMRPFVATAFVLAHAVAPESWLGFNLVMMTAFIAKGALLYALLRRLRLSSAFALASALLLLIYPADAGLFTMRAINIHTAVAAYLLAIYALLSFHQQRRVLSLIVMWAALAFALLTYEIVYPLVIFTPALLIWQDGRWSRRALRSALAWYVVPVLTLIYAAVVFVSGMTYQSWVLQRSGITQPDILAEMARAVGLMLRRHALDGWSSGLALIVTTYVGLAAAAIAAAALLVRRRFYIKPDTPPETRSLPALLLVGVAALMLGWILYLPTPFRDVDWRGYYYSSIGAALIVVALIRWLTQQHFTAAMLLVLTPAFAWALHQHAHYVRLSQQQVALLGGITRLVPGFSPGTTFVVIDETGSYHDNWTLGTGVLVEYALQFIYQDYALDAILCSFDPVSGAFRTLPELREQCAFTADRVVVYRDGQVADEALYSAAILLRHDAEGTHRLATVPSEYGSGARGYAPERLINPDAPTPPRAAAMFGLQ